MKKKLLEVNHLNVFFQTKQQKVHAVRDLSFTLYEGETLGIVGESGCGKSATLKSLLKLYPEQNIQLSGNAQFHSPLKSWDLVSASEKEMQKIRGKEISMIFQDPMVSLNPVKRIGAQIVEGYLRHFPHISYDEAKKEAIHLLRMVGMAEAEGRMQEYPHTLSGGMRQRVMIALALISKPKILFADEPTTALDVTIQAQIVDLLKQMQQRLKTTILLITHDLSLIATLCDRVLVMYAGHIVESGDVYQLFQNPRHPYTQRLLQSIPRLDQPKEMPLIPIEGFPPDLSLPFTGCAFSPRCSHTLNKCQTEMPPLEEECRCWLYKKESSL